MSYTRTMSITGTPSVMAMTILMPASTASRMASAVNAGGTKIIVASAPVCLTASLTVTVDGEGPVIACLQPIDGGMVNASPGVLAFQGTVNSSSYGVVGTVAVAFTNGGTVSAGYGGSLTFQSADFTMLDTSSASGVTFNNLAPGAIATPRNAGQLANPERKAQILAQIPARRLGTPDDLVGAAILLCSNAGSYINGADLFVDGGFHVS